MEELGRKGWVEVPQTDLLLKECSARMPGSPQARLAVVCLPGRNSYVICGAQCEMNTQGPLLKIVNSGTLNQAQGPSECGVPGGGMGLVPMKPALLPGIGCLRVSPVLSLPWSSPREGRHQLCA